jgi:molybdate transport system substrate-binding protein
VGFATPEPPPTARIAVAANFLDTARILTELYTADNGATIEWIAGSSGKHYNMIVNGAPFDALLSADLERPRKLEEEGRTIAGTRFTYAVGVLVLWSPRAESIDPGFSILDGSRRNRIALAKPELAPFGLAAQETLMAMGRWDTVEPRLVYGSNVSQALQFAQSGNAAAAFVALSQVLSLPEKSRGAHLEIPPEMHQPILQQAVLLRENPTARGFLEFMKTPQARETIRLAGYRPAPTDDPKDRGEDNEESDD